MPAPGSVAPGAAADVEPFIQPEVLTSQDGFLEVALRAEASQLAWGDTTRYSLTYNGSAPGPTLRVRPGDRLQIRLENRLDEPTNLHTHGLHVSPEGDGDNIFETVGPGEDRGGATSVPRTENLRTGCNLRARALQGQVTPAPRRRS